MIKSEKVVGATTPKTYFFNKKSDTICKTYKSFYVFLKSTNSIFKNKKTYNTFCVFLKSTNFILKNNKIISKIIKLASLPLHFNPYLTERPFIVIALLWHHFQVKKFQNFNFFMLSK